MKKPIRIVILILLIVCLGCMLSACSLFDFSEETENDNNAFSPAEDKNVYIGETVVNSKDIAFKVVRVQNAKSIGGMAATQNNYIIVTLSISNRSSKTWEQNPNNCTLIKGDATYQYNSNTFLLGDGMSGFDEINPGITKTMSIAFETPTKSTEEEYSIKLSGYSWLVNDSVTIVLKERP